MKDLGYIYVKSYVKDLEKGAFAVTRITTQDIAKPYILVATQCIYNIYCTFSYLYLVLFSCLFLGTISSILCHIKHGLIQKMEVFPCNIYFQEMHNNQFELNERINIDIAESLKADSNGTLPRRYNTISLNDVILG